MREETIDALRGIAHADRLRALEAFAKEDRRSPTAIAEELGIPLGNASYHARQLLRFGLIERAGERPVRGALEHFYRLTGRGRAALAAARTLDDSLGRDRPKRDRRRRR